MNNEANLLSMIDGPVVSLEQILHSRDERKKQQLHLLQKNGYALICLTLVMPGPIKKSSGSQFIFQKALSAFNTATKTHQWLILDTQIESENISGPQAFYSVKTHDLNTLKKILVELEETHELGRLWDFDILDNTLIPISRESLGVASRACLICSNTAHACARSKAHTLDQLLDKILHMINNNS